MSTASAPGNKHLALTQLKRKYSAALYSYFRITNLASACEAFINGDIEFPHFTYPTSVNENSIKHRYEDIKDDFKRIPPDNLPAQAFLQWRLSETELLEQFWSAYTSNSKIQKSAILEYQLQQIDLYGQPDHALFAGIIAYVKTLAYHSNSPIKITLYSEIESLLSRQQSGLLYAPQPEIFSHYQKLFRQAFPALAAVLRSVETKSNYESEEIAAIFDAALIAVGAKEEGWKVRLVDGGANIIVSKHRKEVLISKQVAPKTPNRLRQMVAHEVGCHVQRALHDSRKDSNVGIDEHDEGLAIVLEQLLANRFSYKRLARYLAVCLGIGVDGTPRNFRDVFEVLWRTMVIRGDSKHVAKERAFYECARIFRGGLPAVNGMVYIKDKIYLESNLFIWQRLCERPLELEEFRRLFTGHDTMLIKEVAS